METYGKPSTSKLVSNFDIDLKSILMNDLKAFKEKIQFLRSNNQATAQSNLSAA